MNDILRFGGLLGLLLYCALAMAATEIVPLNYRTSSDMLPVVQSFLGSEGRASAYGNQLIVDAPPAKIAELKTFLAQLDAPAKRLLISVDTSDTGVQSADGYSINGSINAGNTRLQAGNGSNQTRIINRNTASRSGGVQQVQASEGYPALIQVGQSVPLTSVSGDAYGRPQVDTQYRNVTQGFYVTASLTGDIVHLRISTNNDRVNQSRPDIIDIQSSDTQLSGPVGTWLQLGGVQESRQAQQNGVTRQYSTQSRDAMNMRVKVDVLN